MMRMKLHRKRGDACNGVGDKRQGLRRKMGHERPHCLIGGLSILRQRCLRAAFSKRKGNHNHVVATDLYRVGL
jgi:hypothetical protein